MLGAVQQFNYLDHNKLYSGECAKIYGSAGELFPPKRLRDSIALYTPDLCRSIPFDYERDVTVHGVTGYRYTGGERAVDNGTKFPQNLCFNGKNDVVVPSGVMNISACRYGSPVFMSFPHYFAGDQFFLDEVDGLEPSKAKHESYFTLEPVSGDGVELLTVFDDFLHLLADRRATRSHNSSPGQLPGAADRGSFTLPGCSADIHASNVV
jgi:scavenger receptor class B, member 1